MEGSFAAFFGAPQPTFCAHNETCFFVVLNRNCGSLVFPGSSHTPIVAHRGCVFNVRVQHSKRILAKTFPARCGEVHQKSTGKKSCVVVFVNRSFLRAHLLSASCCWQTRDRWIQASNASSRAPNSLSCHTGCCRRSCRRSGSPRSAAARPLRSDDAIRAD